MDFVGVRALWAPSSSRAESGTSVNGRCRRHEIRRRASNAHAGRPRLNKHLWRQRRPTVKGPARSYGPGARCDRIPRAFSSRLAVAVAVSKHVRVGVTVAVNVFAGATARFFAPSPLTYRSRHQPAVACARASCSPPACSCWPPSPSRCCTTPPNVRRS